MKNFNLVCLGVAPVLFFLGGCASVPKDAPDEIKQASAEIEKSKDLDTEDYMPTTLANAEKDLDDSIAAFKKSKSDNSNRADFENSIKLANNAKELAVGANAITKNVQVWDANIKDLNGNYSITDLMSQIKDMQTVTAQLKTENEQKELALAQKPMMIGNRYA